MKFAVIVFPGTTGDGDCVQAVADTLNESVQVVPHTATDLSDVDCIILPGGASYGDYLRAGAVASITPVMEAVKEAASEGKLILGIGNGFQILLEAGLLPGAMLPNKTLKFQAKSVTLQVENNETPFTSEYAAGEAIELPIAHGTGNYYASEATLAELKQNKQIVLRYRNENPNGSIEQIAAICNQNGNVLGMMPHPERAIQAVIGSEDGVRLFTSILKTWREKHDAAAK